MAAETKEIELREYNEYKYIWELVADQYGGIRTLTHQQLNSLSKTTLKYLYLLFKVEHAVFRTDADFSTNCKYIFSLPDFQTLLHARDKYTLDCKFVCPDEDLRDLIDELVLKDLRKNTGQDKIRIEFKEAIDKLFTASDIAEDLYDIIPTVENTL
jgi:hypothetical protein